MAWFPQAILYRTDSDEKSGKASSDLYCTSIAFACITLRGMVISRLCFFYLLFYFTLGLARSAAVI
jgi:hypothetical protein